MTHALGTHGDASRIAEFAQSSLREAIAEIAPLAAALGLRRFYRLRAASGRTLIARVEAEEDPAGRPPGIPAEPPLEPIRARLERAGLPVPKCYGSAPGIALLEDFGDESLYARSLHADAGALQALVSRALNLVPRIQRVTDDGSFVAAFEIGRAHV